MSCQSVDERKHAVAETKRVNQDSSKPMPNPFKVGQGTGIYDRERENLGNLDSLVTLPQPSVPTR